MSEPRLFHCPTCGASLPIPDAAAIQCEYCGSNVVVPAELRKKEPVRGDLPKIDIQQARPIVIQAGSARPLLKPFLTIFFVLLLIGILIPVLLIAAGVFTASSLISSLTGESDSSLIEVIAAGDLLPAGPGGAKAEVLLQFGGEGSGAGQFDDPREIALDLAGNIYIADYDGGRVQKFDPDGTFVFLINVEPDQNDNIYIQGLATDFAGNLYVARSGDILIYSTEDGSPAGSILGEFPATNYEALAISPSNELYSINDKASGQDLIKLDKNGQILWRQEDFIKAIDKDATLAFLKLAVDGLGNSYAIGMNGEHVYKFGPEGAYIDRFGSPAEDQGQFQSPQNISVDGQGRVYVCDTNGVHIFDPNGAFIVTLPWDLSVGVLRDAAVDAAGNIIVITLKGQVVKYGSPLDN